MKLIFIIIASIAILGQSHAAMLANTFKLLGNRAGRGRAAPVVVTSATKKKKKTPTPVPMPYPMPMPGMMPGMIPQGMMPGMPTPTGMSFTGYPTPYGYGYQTTGTYSTGSSSSGSKSRVSSSGRRVNSVTHPCQICGATGPCGCPP